MRFRPKFWRNDGINRVTLRVEASKFRRSASLCSLMAIKVSCKTVVLGWGFVCWGVSHRCMLAGQVEGETVQERRHWQMSQGRRSQSAVQWCKVQRWSADLWSRKRRRYAGESFSLEALLMEKDKSSPVDMADGKWTWWNARRDCRAKRHLSRRSCVQSRYTCLWQTRKGCESLRRTRSPA